MFLRCCAARDPWGTLAARPLATKWALGVAEKFLHFSKGNARAGRNNEKENLCTAQVCSVYQGALVLYALFVKVSTCVYDLHYT